jgi:hypothetical protein
VSRVEEEEEEEQEGSLERCKYEGRRKKLVDKNSQGGCVITDRRIK